MFSTAGLSARGGLALRRADTQNPDTLAFLARTPTRKRPPHSTVYERLKAFFDTRAF